MGSIQKEWLVYFHPSLSRKYSKWAKWWTFRPNFGHCGALQYISKLDLWIEVQGTHAGLDVTLLTPKQISAKLEYLYNYEILICPEKNDWHFTNFNLLSCVTVIMKLIGFYKWWIVTPYQLYCALRKAGYKPFWNKSNKEITNGQNTTTDH